MGVVKQAGKLEGLVPISYQPVSSSNPQLRALAAPSLWAMGRILSYVKSSLIDSSKHISKNGYLETKLQGFISCKFTAGLKIGKLKIIDGVID